MLSVGEAEAGGFLNLRAARLPSTGLHRVSDQPELHIETLSEKNKQINNKKHVIVYSLQCYIGL